VLDKLFTNNGSGVLPRHQMAPFLEERVKFLELRSKAGHDDLHLRNVARMILWAARSFHRDIVEKTPIMLVQVRFAGKQWFKRQCRCRNRKSNRKRYLKYFEREVSSWLRSMELLGEEKKRPEPYRIFITDYLAAMEHEHGFAPNTINNKRKATSMLLKWYFSKKRSIASIRIADIDRFVAWLSKRGYCRRSLATIAAELRSFFRYARRRGWCRHINPEAIEGPKLYRSELLPAGPHWDDAQKIVESAETDRAADIRDLPILILFATYGLRSSEVAKLKLEDIDWKKNRIRIHHAKNRRTEWYPLVPAAGNAILRYLRSVRLRNDYREVFLKLVPPITPISGGSLYDVVCGRMKKLGIHGLHRGPHSLRHSCATHLLAEGFSLKEVGDQLGHLSVRSTSTYAKVDLNQLRAVAEFNFGDVL
jgi:integrase/recombinase XerD